MNQHDETVAEIRRIASENGLTVRAGDGLVSVSATFPPGDRDAYNAKESAAFSVLARCRANRPGSTWGTDGIGGAIALRDGRFSMKKSGVAKLLCRAIAASR